MDIITDKCCALLSYCKLFFPHNTNYEMMACHEHGYLTFSFLSIKHPPLFQVYEVMANDDTLETLDEIPPHVWKGLPDYMKLGPSAINQNRIGEETKCGCSLPYFDFCMFHHGLKG